MSYVRTKDGVFNTEEYPVGTITKIYDQNLHEQFSIDNPKVGDKVITLKTGIEVKVEKESDDIINTYWLFDTEQTIIFHAYAVDSKGKYDKEIGTCYFIRTKSGGWFSAYANMFFWCELDVDNRWYDKLIKEEFE